MPELLSGLPGFGGRDGADRRLVQRSARWRLRLYEALAARYRMNQGFMQTVRRLADRKHKQAPRSREAAILGRWADRMEREGDTLDIVLDGWIPSDELLIIRASLDDRGLGRAAGLIEKLIARRGMARTALFYPAILVVMLIAMLMIIGTMVMPNVLAMQSRQGIPPSTLFVFLATHAWITPLPFLGAFLAIRWSLPLWTGPRRIWFDRTLWPWTQYRRAQGVAFLYSYGAMWGGGLTDLGALYAIAETSNAWLRQRILAIAHWVEEGVGLGEAMHQCGFGFPDQETIEDIGDIEASPEEMARHLEILADREAKLLQQQFESLATVSSVVVMVIVAMVLVLIVSSIVSAFNFGAMLDLMGSQGVAPR